MKGFKESETIELINYIKEAKIQGKSLLSAFNDYAKKTGRSMGTIRNYYYKTVKKCKGSEGLRQKLGVDKALFPAFILEFNLEQEKELLLNVLTKTTQGKSVRRAISEISNGNEKLALRNQNKYRNLLKQKPWLVNEVILEVEKKLERCKNPYLEISNSLSGKLALEESINNLLLTLENDALKENSVLTQKVKELSIQNGKMKELLKKALKKNDITKEFIKKVT
ncbi:MAG: hypothetical protein IKV61_01820 [Clostridia bacterium]|nr:hypothetical protein [Clostridia bacterium]